MKTTLTLLVLTFALAAGFSVSAQPAATPKTFDRHGATFGYPADWIFQDTSTNDSDEMNFEQLDLDVQFKVFIFRTPLTTPEKLAQARKILVDRYIATTTQSFENANAHPVSTPSTSEIGGVAAQGVKIRASLDGTPGSAEIEWAVVNDRMVVLTILGPDDAVKGALPAWDMVRTTMKIAPEPPATVPVKKPK